MKTPDPASVIQDVVRAANSCDTEAMVRHFAGDATLMLSPPLPPPFRPVYHGRDGVREYVRELVKCDFRVESGGFRASGDRVTWRSRVSADAFRQMGLEHAEATSEAVVWRGLIQSIAIHYSPESLAVMQEALATRA
jgi:ketosteroid isomerase-like protein